MANITSLKDTGVPANNEVGRGFTRQVTITSSDFVDNAPSGEADNDPQTYEICTIPAGSYVRGVYFYVSTEFDDSGGGANLTVALGDAGDADGFTAAAQIHTDHASTVVTGLNDGAFFNDGTTNDVKNAKAYSTASTVEALFTPSGGWKLSELTAGEIRIVVDIVELGLV